MPGSIEGENEFKNGFWADPVLHNFSIHLTCSSERWSLIDFMECFWSMESSNPNLRSFIHSTESKVSKRTSTKKKKKWHKCFKGREERAAASGPSPTCSSPFLFPPFLNCSEMNTKCYLYGMKNRVSFSGSCPTVTSHICLEYVRNTFCVPDCLKLKEHCD